MDIPFTSSGAMSRAHYSLVRRVESATSTQLADQYLLAEIRSIRHQLSQPALSLLRCKECLLVLLYCSMSVSCGLIASGALDFALSHAVSLAEAGSTVQDKRIGYIFCAELMSPSHELQLMLINTLRKDLESRDIPRICLALDNVIVSSTQDLIPAVQSCLHVLLSHSSFHVRRRALMAVRALSRHDQDFLGRITGKIVKRLKDSHSVVVAAALIVSADLVEIHDSVRKEVQIAVNEILRSTWSGNYEKSTQQLVLKVLRALHTVGLSHGGLDVVLEIIRSALASHDHVLLRGAFLLLSNLTTDILLGSQITPRLSPVHNIRPLLTSRDPNDQYLFLACLECVDPILWAGTRPDIPAVLEEWEVARVMQLLDSPDKLIRKKTLRILNRIDSSIVASYYSHSLQTIPLGLNVRDKNEYVTRLLEVLEIQCAEDGELYARQVKELFGKADTAPPGGDKPVLENAIEMVLLYVRNASPSFRIGCTTALVTSIAELETYLGPTLMVIIPALASEYSGRLSIPPRAILRGLSNRLTSCPTAIQDPCLLAMLRIVADCDEVPLEVTSTVTELGQFSPGHIRRRCDQFVTLSAQKNLLAGIVKSARSSTLPDFLEALQTQNTYPISSRPMSPHSPGTSPRVSTRKLRYTAYEPPSPTQPIRTRRLSNTQRSDSSPRSATLSDHGHELSRVSSRLSGTSERWQPSDGMSRTVTAGDLALVAGAQEFEMMARIHSTPESVKSPRMASPVEDLSARVDLIAFDSPFMEDTSGAEVIANHDEPDFESIWNSLDQSSGARGWCNDSMDGVVSRLQGLGHRLKVTAIDRLPFEGDLKILIWPENQGEGVDGKSYAVLRLRESEEESCLWRLRCGDHALRIQVKRLLTDG